MAHLPDHFSEPPSVIPASDVSARSLLDLLTPADLPDLLPAHPDEYPLVATANEPYFGDVLNLQTLREKRGPAAKVAGRDHRQICRQITKVDLNKIPEEFFGEGSVGFFTALEHPSHRSILPRLVHACENDRLPIALFHPASITEENALTVAAALVCFANSMTPSQTPTPGEIVACGDDL